MQGVVSFSSISTPITYPGFTSSTNSYKTSRLHVESVIESNAEVGTDDTIKTSDTVIVGAGPAGLLSAIMMAQKFPKSKVQVYDRLSPPPDPTDKEIWSDVAKFYLLGLGSRGQNALAKYGVWEDVKAVCSEVNGRKDWTPEAGPEEGIERIFTDRPTTTQVLPRDKLVGVLHKHVLDNYSDRIVLNYGYEIIPENFEADNNEAVNIRVLKCNDETRVNPTSVSVKGDMDPLCDIEGSFTVSTKLLIAADGTSRTVANAMENTDEEKRRKMNFLQRAFAGKPFKVTRYEDDNQRVYKTIPMKIPLDWRPDLNYSARTKDGRINYDALPADKDGNYCGVLLMRANDEFSAPDTDPKGLRELLDSTLPQFSVLLDDATVASIAKKPPSFLPSFRYVGPRLNQGDHTLVLGDSAHTVKPYFGLGANSALEDVKILDESIDETNSLPEAVHLFSKRRAMESEVLVKISRDLDRPGFQGFVTFILPLILDSIFHKMFPKVFNPNTISMLQKENITFRGVRRRKRMDRIGQLAVIGTSLSTVALGMKSAIKLLSRLTGRNSSTILSIITGVTFGYVMLKKMAFYLNPNVAPADVMAKTKSKISNNETFISKEGDATA